ncbi:MAG TPA: ABC transporter ATP-binding protein [Acidimicrobiales bacterium]|nr:ABC transporter ATP-binding protein [Acidimicrobiales bacterium]
MSEAIPGQEAARLVARDISVAYDGFQVLTDVSIDVGPGEIVGLIGPNGAGKTTLFDCLSGFVPGTGRIWVDGREVTALAPHRRARAGLGRSFQDARLYHSLTVFDTLRVAAETRVRPAPVVLAMANAPASRRAEAETTALALEHLEVLGLQPYRDKLVRELSTGTRRIVDLAGLLLQGPAVVLLDEPSSGIAQKEVEALRPLLLSLRDRTGCSILLIEHDMPLLLGLADRVYALETGVVIAEGAPDEVVHDPEVVRSYLGTDATAIERSGTARHRKV